jgi:hypothetical protein
MRNLTEQPRDALLLAVPAQHYTTRVQTLVRYCDAHFTYTATQLIYLLNNPLPRHLQVQAS